MVISALAALAAPPDGMIEVNYHRCDAKYERWGVHLWKSPNMPLPDIEWPNPMMPTGKNDFGVFWHVKADEFTAGSKMQVNYILIPPGSFAKDTSITENDIQRHFDAHREDFLEPEAVSATVITLPLGPEASAADKSAAMAKGKELRAQIAGGADISAAAAPYNATVKQTGFFSVDNPSPEITPSLELLQSLFTAKAGDLLEPAAGSAGVQVIKITEKKQAFTPELAVIKDKVKSALVKEQTLKIATEKAAGFLQTISEKIKGGMDFPAAARAAGFEPKQTPFFGLGEYVPEIGMSDDFTTTAFTLDKEHALSGVVKTSNGPVIISWLATQPADEKKFLEVKKDFTDSLYAQERVHVMNELIKSLREKAQLQSRISDINAKQKEALKKMRVK